MFGLVRTAVRFFFIGFGVGVLLAPRAGAETRALIREKLNTIANSVLEVADLPPLEGTPTDASARNASSAQPNGRRGRTRQSEGTGAGAQT